MNKKFIKSINFFSIASLVHKFDIIIKFNMNYNLILNKKISYLSSYFGENR